MGLYEKKMFLSMRLGDSVTDWTTLMHNFKLKNAIVICWWSHYDCTDFSTSTLQYATISSYFYVSTFCLKNLNNLTFVMQKIVDNEFK